MRAELQALRLAIVTQRITDKTPRQVRTEQRHERLRELAEAIGIGSGWPGATEIVLVLFGNRQAPDGFGSLVEKLRRDDECPRSVRGIYRVISQDD